MSNEQKTDLQLANESLVELSPNVTANDRKEAPVSLFTVVQYLKGRGQDLDTAVKLLMYFRGRIEERRRVINEV
jgi:hypothetical protein